MVRAAPVKAATYGKTRGKVAPPKKQPSPPSDNDDETEKDDSMAGKLLDELEDSPPSKTKSKPKPTPIPKAKTPAAKPKSILKPSPRKGNSPSLPPSSKVNAKSKLSNEIKPTPPKGTESESDYDSEEEKEKVKAKSLPKPLKGKKEDSSKLPSSNDSSVKSTQSKTSTITRGKKEIAEKKVLPSHPSSDDIDDEFGPGFDVAMLDAVEKDLEAKGFSSSPTLATKGKKATSPIPSPIEPTADIDMNKDQLDNDEDVAEPDADVHAEEEIPADQDELLSSNASEEGSDSLSPEPKNRTPNPRSEKLKALKRQADYDSNAIEDTAGLLLADMSPSSPSKKARLSPPITKSAEEESEVAKKINQAVRSLSARRPASIPATVIPKARGKKVVAPLPPIDYEAMISPYGKEVVQRLMLKQFDSIKKCDWFELSIELADEGVKRASDGKKGKKGKDSIISANELHELFHHVRPTFLFVDLS